MIVLRCRGVEGIIPEVFHGQPQMGLQPPPPTKKKELAKRGDLLLLKSPQKTLAQLVIGGLRKGVLGTTHACFLSKAHCVNGAPCTSWPGGGGGPLWWAVLTMMTTSIWLSSTSSHLGTWPSIKAVPA